MVGGIVAVEQGLVAALDNELGDVHDEPLRCDELVRLLRDTRPRDQTSHRTSPWEMVWATEVGGGLEDAVLMAGHIHKIDEIEAAMEIVRDARLR